MFIWVTITATASKQAARAVNANEPHKYHKLAYNTIPPQRSFRFNELGSRTYFRFYLYFMDGDTAADEARERVTVSDVP